MSLTYKVAQGPQGEQGPAGNSVTILGSYADLAAFEAGAGAAPGANIGDAWILLSDGSLQSWNGSAWFDAGDIKGPQGEQGPEGPQGPAGTPATAPEAVRYSPVFSATGLAFTGTGATYPTYESWYVKFGQMCTFSIKVKMTTVTNFGTGQFKVELPFLPKNNDAEGNHFPAWAWVNPAISPDDLNGHIVMVADHLPNSLTLDLHWLKAATSNPKPVIESLFSQGDPVTLTTASFIYVNGTYITAV